MKLRNINRIIPYCSIVGLGMLGLVIINPMCSSNTPLDNNSNKAYAAENTNTGSSISLTINGWTSSNGNNSNITNSITTTELSTAYISHNVSVSVSNAASYSLQLTAASGKTSNLVHTDGKTTITGANGTVGNSLSDNTWGYSWGETSADVAGMNYYTLPAYGATVSNVSNGLLESANADSNGNASFTKKLTFAAKFGNNAPDGSYSTEILISLVVDPKIKATMNSISTMQEMTTDVCNNSAVGDTATLRDTRDGSTYTIAKIKNQTNDNALCWMTQNLRLINKELSSEDSDVVDIFTIPVSNISGFTTTDQTKPKAYYGYNALYGVYYNWYTATAGTNGSGSICPKGWRLPTGGQYTGELYDLLRDVKAVDLVKNPYAFVYGGSVSSGSLNLAGSNGVYWSSTRIQDNYNMQAYSLSFDSDNAFYSNAMARYGSSVRCVAR